MVLTRLESPDILRIILNLINSGDRAMDQSIEQQSSATITDSHVPGAALPPPVSSTSLLGQQGSLHIDHRGAIYTLRATSKGGLILTK